jgi:hypothetical protein
MAATTGKPSQDLTQLHLDVARGRAGGKVIWQPRIGCWVSDKHFAGTPLPEPYEGLTMPGIYRALGCSNRIYEFNACFVAAEDPDVRFTQAELGGSDFEVRIDTPVGSQRAIYRRSENNAWARPVKRPVASEEELRVAIWREERRTWSWDQPAYDRLCEEWAGLGAPTMYLPRVSVQKLYIDEMGVEEAVLALMDYPDTCEAFFAALRVNEDRLIDVINASPIELIDFGDNVHSATLSPELFERWVLPAYQWRTAKLRAGGKWICAHWDGDCRPLLPYARETGLDGIEAITPQPQGDVTLEETKAALGDMFLLDGIPAVYFDETYSEDVLLDCARQCIELFAPHLILGISDEISSTGDIERIRLVGDLVEEYNASL